MSTRLGSKDIYLQGTEQEVTGSGERLEEGMRKVQTLGKKDRSQCL